MTANQPKRTAAQGKQKMSCVKFQNMLQLLLHISEKSQTANFYTENKENFWAAGNIFTLGPGLPRPAGRAAL